MVQLPWVISIDDHVVEPPTLWGDRLPARLRDRGPRVERDTYEIIRGRGIGGMRIVKGGNGPMTDWWLYEDLAKTIPQVTASAGFPPEQWSVGPIGYDEMRPGCWQVPARLADMDVNHTERSMCFPLIPRFGGAMFLEAKDKDLAWLCVQAYNDWMIEEWCGESAGRLIPLCLIPLWDPGLAAAEVRRNAARGCRAVVFTELPANLGLPSLHDVDRYWDPLLDACNETGTVVCMHIGSGSVMPTTSADAPAAMGPALTSLNAYMAMTDWLLSGALVRFPRLKIAFAESQIGWMPFLMERLDMMFAKSRAWIELDPSVTEPPSSYVAGHVYGCFFDDMVGIDMRDRIGIEQLVFEIDYPHQDTTWPDSMKLVSEIAERVSPEELEKLVRTNAIEMLDLDPTSPLTG
jgi:predicted TIM-barrel fold metal-dependent hydrolase